MTDLPPVPEGLELSEVGNDESGMFRSVFGDPKPANLTQMNEVLTEFDVSTKHLRDAIVGIDYSDDEGVFAGYSACISVIRDDGERELTEISTLGFKDKGELTQMLVAVGIPAHNIETWS